MNKPTFTITDVAQIPNVKWIKTNYKTYIYADMPPAFWDLPACWHNFYFWEAFEENLIK